MRRRAMLPILLLTLLGVATLSACGDDADPAASSNDPIVVKVTISGGEITTSPAGDVDVALGQDVSLEITSDVADEVHVHSNPEQEHEFTAGSTTLDLGSFSVPGQVDVEVHDLDAKLVTLVVE